MEEIISKDNEKMIKLTKLRIKNYKSIKDSGDIFLSSDGITVLAGMNESGKTSILEALNDFNVGNSIAYDVRNIENRELEPEIELFFETNEFFLKTLFKEKEELNYKMNLVTLETCFNNLSDEERIKKINAIKLQREEYWEEYVDKHKKAIFNFSISKNTNGYTVSNFNEIFKLSNVAYEFMDEFGEVSCEIGNILDSYQIESKMLPTFNFDQNGVYYYAPLLSEYIYSINSKLQNNINPQDQTLISKMLSLLQELLENVCEPKERESVLLKRVLEKTVPNFILFEIYDKNGIPGDINKINLDDNAFLADLATICGLDMEKIKNGNVCDKINHLNSTNKILNEKYSPFWNQDDSELNMGISDGNLNFMISENGTVYPVSVRSAGRKWHLAFFIKTSSQFKENVENIILIDEPGIHLHAKAQRDILNKIEETSKNAQIIYSTHSPYLLNPKKLTRIKLVEKTIDGGTKVKNKAWITAKEDSLTPILTAIGEDVSLGIRIDRVNNFIVEGISDYLYLQAFKKLIDFHLEFDMIPCLGNNVLSIVSILRGWNLEPYFIFDNDKKGIKFKEQILKDGFIPEDDIFFMLDKEGTVEELFSEKDFKKHVLYDENADLSKGLNKYLKNSGKSKALISQQFLNNVDEGKILKDDLSKETLKNVNRVFNWISEKLNSSNN
ncbi:AAA family ATPase [Methanococcus maripaludis]|uniref:Endonuclease GajA/Old nuclease/RecF-like AAA domain-containing protein n=2 Tax=Methanococcus maripaludis TaxID=39152 RepID=A6VHM6_METM7|nr:AAA family ATPase [Methanococcus maripaludis]MBA2861611.1 putative ATP-dependent endonuclease of OLD family [Methanococcus maripaludis]